MEATNDESPMLRKRLHAFVSGRVQGVWFRKNTVLTANKIGDVTGWCKNLSDGRVEVVAEGTEAKLQLLVDFLNVGPELARVINVETSFSAATGEFTSFGVRK